MTNRIGPQMSAAVYYVSHNPGEAILPIAKRLHIGARRGTNNALGYSPVHRAISAGLLCDCPAGVSWRPEGRRGLYSLFTPEQVAGARAAAALESFLRAFS